MEIKTSGIIRLTHLNYLTLSADRQAKTWLMNPAKKLFNRLIIFVFMILVGYCLARGIQYQSVMGIILAVVSLGACIYFLYLLAKMKHENEKHETA